MAWQQRRRRDRPDENDAVRVDPEKKLAFIQAGADGGDVDHETALHNLVCVTGTVSHTGFAGVALGGGIGHLSRWLGAVVDSIVGYEMVTATGKVIRVDEAKDSELFWGMRGMEPASASLRSSSCGCATCRTKESSAALPSCGLQRRRRK